MEEMAVEDVTAASLGLNPRDPMAQRIADETKKNLLSLSKYVSPPGSLGLPPLLDERRVKMLVPDGAFRIACAFDRIIMWPLADDKFGEGKASEHIYFADVGREADAMTSPRGLLIGAGLEALDVLRSNGMDIGHICWLMHLNPWWVPCEKTAEGKCHSARVCRVGDLLGSEDLELERRAGRMTLGETSKGLACWKERGVPVAPDMSNDY